MCRFKAFFAIDISRFYSISSGLCSRIFPPTSLGLVQASFYLLPMVPAGVQLSRFGRLDLCIGIRIEWVLLGPSHCITASVVSSYLSLNSIILLLSCVHFSPSDEEEEGGGSFSIFSPPPSPLCLSSPSPATLIGRTRGALSFPFTTVLFASFSLILTNVLCKGKK